MSHCIAVLKVILVGCPRRQRGVVTEHPCAQIGGVERGLRNGVGPLQEAFLNLPETRTF